MKPTDPLREAEPIRLDRWLWASRFFKTRTIAAKACDGGKVEVNGQSAKPHKAVKPGDIIDVTTLEWRRKLKVLKLSDKRGPVALAQLLYEEVAPPVRLREDWVFAPPPLRPRGTGRPTKRERRKIGKLRGH